INAHASLLPRLRGAAPIERAILEGHDKTGVSIIRMNERMDEGDIILSAAVDLHSGVDGGTLRATLAELSAELLDEAIERIADGTAVYTPQDSSLATFAPPIKREEMRIDWSEDAAAVLRRVMAFRPRPGAFAYACGKRLKILSAELADSAPSTAEAGVILEASAKGLLVACGEGTVLVTSVQPEGRREMSVGDFLRGFPSTAPLLSFDVET
ncbi:MAG: methionyl-tRNA formyltransferase, partial [Candidatus Binatia bacterium]